MQKLNKINKAILVTGHGGPKGCEMLRLPYFLDNWLIDGSDEEEGLWKRWVWSYRKVLFQYFTGRNKKNHTSQSS
jgi:hypothetical protein